jgi:hypothetical protein
LRPSEFILRRVLYSSIVGVLCKIRTCCNDSEVKKQ